MVFKQRTMAKVITYGVFDLLHVGHLASLQKCRELGHLTVGVFSDEVAESFKRKPIIPEEQRLEMILALRCVDDAFILKSITPDVSNYDIVAKGPGAGFEDKTFPNKVLLEYHPITSTSKIIKIINDRNIMLDSNNTTNNLRITTDN
jgi:cytidyltransferase-like protein